MDFSYLMELAQQNKKNATEEKKQRFSTTVSAPKKEMKRPKNSAVAAFQQKKIEEQRIKDTEFKKKKDDLLALRAKGKNIKRIMSAQKKRTLAASKAVLDEAKDLVVLRGEEQCDEDDYGYESAMSQKIFEKLANTYANIPDDERLKFQKKQTPRSLDDIKNRVKGSLQIEEEEKLGLRKRTKKSRKTDDEFVGQDFSGSVTDNLPTVDAEAIKKQSSSSRSSHMPVNLNVTNYKSDKFNSFKYKKGEEESTIVQKKKEKKKLSSTGGSAPPPSFQDLMKMAKEKATNPSTFKPEVHKPDKEKKKDDRPLTAKEREELEEERQRKLRRMKNPYTSPGQPNANKTSKNGSAIKLNGNNSSIKDKSKNTEVRSNPKNTEIKSNHKSTSRNSPAPQPNKLAKSSNPDKLNKSLPEKIKKPEPPKTTDKSKYFAAYKPTNKKDLPNTEQKKVKSRPFPPPGMRSPPLPAMKRSSKPAPPMKKQRIESDSEEDSDMDDFIDDGDEDIDYSSAIKSMFGYDKSKFRDEDDDLDDMESSYHQMEREEVVSAKIGLKEDLDDMRMEEEQKKRKLMKKKMIKQRR